MLGRSSNPMTHQTPCKETTSHALHPKTKSDQKQKEQNSFIHTQEKKKTPARAREEPALFAPVHVHLKPSRSTSPQRRASLIPRLQKVLPNINQPCLPTDLRSSSVEESLRLSAELFESGG